MSPAEVMPPPVEAAVRRAMLETYFAGVWAPGDDSESARADIHDHVRGRFDSIRRWVVPWIAHAIDLPRTRIVEIGCGTGSATAALALEAGHVDAYDIDGRSLEAARRRLELMGLRNATLHGHAPDDVLEAMSRENAPGTADMVLCYAVLEHCKYQERLQLLRLGWEMLRPGGVLVVADTPNLLTYWDAHTFHLPFFNSLSVELALDYAARSPRRPLVYALAGARAASEEAGREKLARLGRGVSYHEFELALGDNGAEIVGDGFDPEPMSFYGVSLETRILYTYAKLKGLTIAPAFLRETIEVILRKPGGSGPSLRPRDLEQIVRPFVEPH